uniref:Uncharacterized protein n=1 Tax=Rhizophora mucronata TaxID=61149 RepID=A0A2P2NQW8_RHIMU
MYIYIWTTRDNNHGRHLQLNDFRVVFSSACLRQWAQITKSWGFLCPM